MPLLKMSTFQPFCITVSLLFSTLVLMNTAFTANSFSTRNRNIGNGDETDHLALLSFKSMIFHDPYRVLSSWNTSFHFCYWEGVTCGKRHRRVVSLELTSRGLEGSLSLHVGNLTFLRNLNLGNNTFQGKIPQELGRLSRLQTLLLGRNNFSGVIPANLSNCSNLVRLSLAVNNLVGNIPEEVGSLSKLELLYLGANKATGDIPPSLYNLSLLTNLSLGDNQLSGSLPPTLGAMLPRLQLLQLVGNQLTGRLPHSISNCSNLEVIQLSENKFYGVIPKEVGSLSQLQLLYLDANKLTGDIPPSLYNCSKLEVLELRGNEFYGVIPKEVRSLSQLHFLSLGANKLTGDIPPSLYNCSKLEVLELQRNKFYGVIPKEVGSLSKLKILYLHYNNLTGDVPSSIYNISLLTNLSLYDNHLTGSLPPTLGATLPRLQFLYLWGNQFTGRLPFSISNCSNLKVLELSINRFYGMLKIDFSQLTNIKKVNLFSNNLGSGEPDEMKFIDSMANCNKLQEFILFDNKFKGVLPSSIGNLSNQLWNLDLRLNQLFGRLPSSIGNLVGLTFLGLVGNKFTGEIPLTIGKLQKLQHLYLSGNQFSGSIPDSIGNMSMLLRLYLFSNMLEGKIPSSLGNCQKLLELGLSQNILSGNIPKALFQLSSLSIYLGLDQNNLSGLLPSEVGQLKNLKELDLSDNNLSGTIPSSFSGCTSLEILYLQGNLFQGTIPPSLSSLRAIANLDLSRNNLSGYIPQFLERFSLQYLNLSSNDFEGEVPVKGIFANGSAFTVSGNRRLCGGLPELGLPKCKVSNQPKTRSHVLAIVIPIVSVLLVISLLSTFAFLWHKKKNKGPHSESTRKDELLRVSYGELQKATNGFSTDNLIGMGGFSSVYKGILSESRIVAVKVLHLQNRVAYKSFETECQVWRNIRHRNLLKVLTSCSSVDFQGNDFKALVYEFMPNGSLDRWLHPSPTISRLNLVQRVSILVDVVSALDYLHNGCQIAIIHCDLKPSNILLDEEMMAHVGDFGLAKFLEADVSHSSGSAVRIRGTIGYAAPEYGLGSEMTTSGDVYSFGILLLEMMTGKRPTDSMFNEDLNLHKLVCTALPDHVTDIVDEVLLNFDQEQAVSANDQQNTLEKAKKIKCLVSILKIGVACSLESPRDRMSIGDVLRHLQHVQDILHKTQIGPA